MVQSSSHTLRKELGSTNVGEKPGREETKKDGKGPREASEHHDSPAEQKNSDGNPTEPFQTHRGAHRGNGTTSKTQRGNQNRNNSEPGQVYAEAHKVQY